MKYESLAKMVVALIVIAVLMSVAITYAHPYQPAIRSAQLGSSTVNEEPDIVYPEECDEIHEECYEIMEEIHEECIDLENHEECDEIHEECDEIMDEMHHGMHQTHHREMHSGDMGPHMSNSRYGCH